MVHLQAIGVNVDNFRFREALVQFTGCHSEAVGADVNLRGLIVPGTKFFRQSAPRDETPISAREIPDANSGYMPAHLGVPEEYALFRRWFYGGQR